MFLYGQQPRQGGIVPPVMVDAEAPGDDRLPISLLLLSTLFFRNFFEFSTFPGMIRRFLVLSAVVSHCAVATFHSAELYSGPARRLDPCVRLCNEFSSDRLGAGETLCEQDQSRCVAPESVGDVLAFCTYLYWSETDDGQPGLMYSRFGDDLTVDECSRIVTCEDAAQILHDTAPLNYL